MGARCFKCSFLYKNSARSHRLIGRFFSSFLGRYESKKTCTDRKEQIRAGYSFFNPFLTVFACPLIGSSCAFLQRFSSFTRGRVRHTKRYSACGVCSAHEWGLLYDATHAPYLLFLSGVLPFLKAGHMSFFAIFMRCYLSESVFKCLFHRPLKRDLLMK